ncbi:uncharacterized protein VTP21DRAFT_2885 [Calcarisporiella thermophila]|uniref:uncharacterized protein n=1 Tax=Calcarisporiella thermophila TaxID=911321 RepID=UPI00374489A8
MNFALPYTTATASSPPAAQTSESSPLTYWSNVNTSTLTPAPAFATTSAGISPKPPAAPPEVDFKPTFYNPFEIKHRRRTSKSQFRILERAFKENPKPSNATRRELACKLNMTPRNVQIWFQNRRAKAKKRAEGAAGKAGELQGERAGGLKAEDVGYIRLVSDVVVGEEEASAEGDEADQEYQEDVSRRSSSDSDKSQDSASLPVDRPLISPTYPLQPPLPQHALPSAPPLYPSVHPLDSRTLSIETGRNDEGDIPRPPPPACSWIDTTAGCLAPLDMYYEFHASSSVSRASFPTHVHTHLSYPGYPGPPTPSPIEKLEIPSAPPLTAPLTASFDPSVMHQEMQAVPLTRSNSCPSEFISTLFNMSLASSRSEEKLQNGLAPISEDFSPPGSSTEAHSFCHSTPVSIS